MPKILRLVENDDSYKYRLLDRLKQDCDYYLKNKDEKHLWAGNVNEQIAKMKELYNELEEKPEWLSMEDIENYEKQMTKNKAMHEDKKGDNVSDIYIGIREDVFIDYMKTHERLDLSDGRCALVISVNDENFNLTPDLREQLKSEGKYGYYVSVIVGGVDVPKKPYDQSILPIYGSSTEWVTRWFRSDRDRCILELVEENKHSNMLDYLPRELFDNLKESDNLKEDTIFGTETADEKAAKADAKEKGLYSESEDEETVDEVADEIQDETPTEDEEENSVLDAQLDELREILPDLDLSLYQVINKENKNEIFYFIGKVAEDSNDVLMLVDSKPEDEEVEEVEESDVEPAEEVDAEDSRFDFIVIPNRYEDFVKLNPRYGNELNPDHEAIMEYLMKCLLEKNPERAKELDKDEEPEVIDVPDENIE